MDDEKIENQGVTPHASMACTPGASVACTGPGGCAGGQICNPAGTAFGGCQCGVSPTDAGPSSRPDTGTPPPPPPPDAGMTGPITPPNCDDQNECTDDAFDGVGCRHTPTTGFKYCRGTNGSCHQGTCCVGCWDGSRCRTNEVEACGDAFTTRGVCSSCNDQNSCTDDSCSNGICANTAKRQFSTCPSGQCSRLNMCTACGGPNQECCDGTTCESGAVCLNAGSSEAWCSPCGGLNEPCCGGVTCEGTLQCNASQMCSDCGGIGQACCLGNTCEDVPCSGTWPSGQCVCGGPNQPCCPDAWNRCNPGLACGTRPPQTNICL